MDFLTKHWAPFRRQFPPLFALVSSDFIPEKRGWVSCRFRTCNFSLILRGEGTFRRSGREWPVVAPCVITQWPGEPVEYGPERGTWSEWYFVYRGSDFKRFRERGFLQPERPVWTMADPAAVRGHLAEFGALTRHPDPAQAAARADRIAERAILDTIHPLSAGGAETTGVRAISGEVRRDIARNWDFEAVARSAGYSRTTFRRKWDALIGAPPGRFLQDLRMAEACRLLVETDLPVKQVAARTGFADELYFSRRFRLEVGHSPRQYRQTFHLRR